jgi:hypothetical protein
MRGVTWVTLCLFSALALSNCGGGTPTLKSIEINQQFAISVPEFTASATYSNGKQVTPAAVSWILWPPGSFVVGEPRYQLTSSPFLPQCTAPGSAWTVAAIAPVDPHAPNSGSIPDNVFTDLVSGKTSSEGGFVATTVQITSP